MTAKQLLILAKAIRNAAAFKREDIIGFFIYYTNHAEVKDKQEWDKDMMAIVAELERVLLLEDS